MRDRESREVAHLRPTVVVRRRLVIDAADLKTTKRGAAPAVESTESDSVEEAPRPRASGFFVRGSARGEAPPEDDASLRPDTASLEGDELEGLEGDEREGDEREGDELEGDELEGDERGAAERPIVARPPLRLPPTVGVRAIAEQLGVSAAQVAAELVSRGFFEVTPASTLSFEAARIAAEAFGRSVVEAPVARTRKAPRAPARRPAVRRAAPTKRVAKTAASSSTKRGAKVAKTKKKRSSRARSGWRAA
ncbi:MAG: translation initiation factor IF-2 N-terminal domain-containing protein [Labilithrix sp.]|nr:translation initiation factor IF-2 N-terminal domain-containing protein [Labilithrix sp.]